MVEQNEPRLFPLICMGELANLDRITLAALQSNLTVRVIAREGKKYSTPTTDALDTIFLPTVPQGQVRIEILFEPGKSDLKKVTEAINSSEL